MADTRDQDRTRQMGADMRQDGMPQGQAPAPRPAPTAMQRAAAARQERFSTFINAATTNQAVIERSLKHHGISFDFFMAALEVGLRNTLKNDEKFFEVVPAQSFIEAVLKATHLGLLPDGKEGAIVRYAEDAAFLPMVEGFSKILWLTGAVVEINHGVVCDGDDFDFQEGDDGYVTHRRSLRRAPDAEVIGAWCVIKLATGGKLIEICDQADLQKIAAVSRATKGPRKDWEREMHRKGPFRRIVKRMPKTPGLTNLIAHDDSAYDLTRIAHDPGPNTIPAAKLFGSRAHVRKPAAEAVTETTVDALAPDDAPADDISNGVHAEGPLIIAVTRMLHAPDLAALALAEIDAKMAASGPDEIAWVEETRAKRLAELAPPAADDDAVFHLQAVISSATGLKSYEDPRTWELDILTKLSAVSGDPLKKFWAVNLGHILDAGENGHDAAAERILDVAKTKGLPMDVPE